jgi:hypothetical protein
MRDRVTRALWPPGRRDEDEGPAGEPPTAPSLGSVVVPLPGLLIRQLAGGDQGLQARHQQPGHHRPGVGHKLRLDVDLGQPGVDEVPPQAPPGATVGRLFDRHRDDARGRPVIGMVDDGAASATITSLPSMPVTVPSGPTSRAISIASSPGPQPMSSTRSPGRGASASTTMLLAMRSPGRTRLWSRNMMSGSDRVRSVSMIATLSNASMC